MRRRDALLAGALACGAPLLPGATSEAQRRRRYPLRVSIRQHTLTVEEYEPSMVIPVTVGQRSREGAKQTSGDLRTPRGLYHIVRLRSGHPMLHRFALLGYPNPDDAARGREAGLISRREAEAIREAYDARHTPPQQTALGGAIGIHGLGVVGYAGEVIERGDFTEGCIAMRNADIDRLWPLLRLGTPVFIDE